MTKKPKDSRRDIFGYKDSRRRKLFDKPVEEEEADQETDLDYGADGHVRPENGVNVSWLAMAFEMTPRTVRSRLAGIRPIRYGGGQLNRPIYNIKEAAARLVDQNVNVPEAIKRMRPQDMPAMLQAVFWDGQNKRADYMKKTGMLWHTDAVLEVLSDTFKTIRAQMQLWPDTLEKSAKLTEQQMKLVQENVDALQDEIYQKLVQNADKRKTPPMADSPLEAVEGFNDDV